MSVFIPATLCYLRHGQEVLMLHRNKNASDSHWGKYNGLGGKFKPEESASECAVREICEESGIVVLEKDIHLNGVIFFPEFDTQLRSWHVFVFTAWLAQKPKTLIECAEGTLGWVATNEVLNLNLWPGDHFFLPRVFAKEQNFFMGKIVYENGQVASQQFL